MASNPGPTTRSRGGDDAVTASSHRGDRESKHERTSSTRKAGVEESTSSGSGRDSRMSTSNKDYNKGDMLSGAVEGRHDDNRESKRRSDKSASSQVLQEPHERPSSTRTPSPSHLRRKPPPPEDAPQRSEPPRQALIAEHEDESMDSPESSFGDIESDIEEAKRAEPREGARDLPPLPPQEQPDPELVTHLESVVAEADEIKKREEESRDRALALKIDHDLNAQPKCVPGGYPEASGDAAHVHHYRSTRSSGGGGFFSSSQPDKYREKYAQAKRRLEEMEQIAIEWQKNAQHHRAIASQHGQELRMTQMELGSAQKHIQHLDNELKAARHELNAVKQQLSDAVNLSEVRGKELKGAQVFLTKADTLSVSDVVQKVTALNEEIFQMAAFLGEVLVYEVFGEGSDRETIRKQVIPKGYDTALALLGETLASALANESLKEPQEPNNPLLVQIVMQIALTQWCARLAMRWTSYQPARRQRESDGGDSKQGEEGNGSIQKQSEYESMLRELYDSIRDHEEQAVAGRWRSLTRAHLPFSANGWDHNLMIGITSIMGVAGWATRQSDEMEQIEKRLASIFKPLLELRKATGEDVTSADLDISIVEPRATFDHKYMEDEYADGRSSSRSANGAPEVVVSTSGLGLKKLTVKKMRDGGVQRHIEMLALPKVVLEKTIKEAMEPPPPAKKKKSKAAGGEGGGILGAIGLS